MKTILFAATLLLAAAAAPASATDDTCLMHRYVEGWGSHGDHAMIVNDRFNHKYLLSLAGYCTDLDFSMAVGIRSPSAMTGIRAWNAATRSSCAAAEP